MYLNRYLHYIELITKSSSGNKNVFLLGRDLLYLLTRLHISSNSSSDSSNVTVAAAAAVFFDIIIISHSNTYLLFQVQDQHMQKLLKLMSYLEMGNFQKIFTPQWTSAQMVAASWLLQNEVSYKFSIPESHLTTSCFILKLSY